jgi:pyruvate,water dikinase
MPQIDTELSTGLARLDRLLTGLIPGDNIVWQVASLEDYLPFVKPYCANALAKGKRLTYFRFAKHPPLVPAGAGAQVRELKPEAGFEAFVSGIHQTIEQAGQGGYYLFDMLSELAVDWYSDQMLGNFFMLTCPYLYDVGAIAYFGLLHGDHSSEAVGPISDTAQVLIDVFRHNGGLYVHPNKVQQRYSPTMYMLHVREGDDFRPVTQSATISEIMTSGLWPGLEGTSPRRGVVNRAFSEAEEIVSAARSRRESPPESTDLFHRLLRICFSRDERMLQLLGQYLTLTDVLAVNRRMIGTGLIGGKSVGMLLARSILKRLDRRWDELLEPHDSFYVGSDVYYTFVVRNGLWWVRQRQKDAASFLDGAESACQRMLAGTFPEYVVKQLAAMLDYYGQSPIIVRSSSLLEDNFGNSFAGKYESVFCANQGPRHKRLEDFLTAVRTIYASTMSQRALTYRDQRGLLQRDEQMALLVQRVSGGMYGDLFYPQVAGVGLSWSLAWGPGPSTGATTTTHASWHLTRQTAARSPTSTTCEGTLKEGST